MARYIIKNKVYDIDKMTLIGVVPKWYKFQGWLSQQLFGDDMGRVYPCNLYRSEKGNWLLTHEGDTGNIGEAITEKEAKSLLLHSDYEKYAELFGSLEEA